MSVRAVCLFLLLIARVAAAADESPLILISLDGFRWDYCDLFPEESAALRKLKREGVSARGLVSVFPSNTFPNHYSIVTGLYPAHHGIVNNDFFDPTAERFFHFNQATSARDSRWWGGEPIWSTAVKQGRKAASYFWVGSEAEIAGARPTYWKEFNYAIPFEQRLDEIIRWLKLPASERPAIITFYLGETNSAGHRYGPDSPELAAAVKYSSDRVAMLAARITAEGREPNLVIVSDHGMTATSAHRVVLLDDIIDLKTVQIDADGSAVALRPLQGDAKSLLKALGNLPHAKAYLAADLPSHLHVSPNPRIAPVWILPEEGWHVGTKASFNRLLNQFREKGYIAGDHGYDPSLATMRGIFIAQGPAFRQGVELAELENIHIYNLLCAVLGLTPAKNDGDDRLVKTALRN